MPRLYTLGILRSLPRTDTHESCSGDESSSPNTKDQPNAAIVSILCKFCKDEYNSTKHHSPFLVRTSYRYSA